MNKIEANHVDFYYGDFHALKTYLYLSPKSSCGIYRPVGVREINILTAFQSNE